MFESETKLPHLLPPSAYTCPQAYLAEQSGPLARCWHLVATENELAKPGDYVTRTIAGNAIQLRNFGGEIRCLSNVCVHRHALICSQAAGNSPSMRCQYHGWEYQADGRTGKIPQPKNFVPIDRDALCLRNYAVAQVGQLVFVNVAEDPTPLREFLGYDFYQLLSERFSSRWRPNLVWTIPLSINWKIPIENSLEAYHVPAVHPHTFREDPGADRSEHGLLPNRTWFTTQLPFCPHSQLDAAFQNLESSVVRLLGNPVSGRYEQHHVFPNLLFSFTDAISLSNCIVPTGPESCVAIVRQFGVRAKEGHHLRDGLASLWGKLTGTITRRILKEDVAIFDAIQAGMRYSISAGLLGRCEERIHRFQQYMIEQTKVSR